jgi:prevent-host-death family protein
VIVSTKELRTRAREILECADRGEPVTITYRGKSRARLSSIEESDSKDPLTFPVFSIWADHEDVEDVASYVRNIRQARDADRH